MGTAIHHTVLIVRDLDASLRFYRDGLGLDVLQDRHVEGDWPGLFDAPSRGLRAAFLGDARVPDDHAGVLELNVFDGDVRRDHRPGRQGPGSSCCRSSSTSRPRCAVSPRSASVARLDASINPDQTDRSA